MDVLTDIAPLATWLRVGAAALLLLAAVSVLSHVLVHVQGYGRRWRGPAARGSAERVTRAGVLLLLLGLLVWGWDLGWSAWMLAALGLAAALTLALEGVAVRRQPDRSPSNER